MVETFQPPRFGAGQQPVKPAHSGRRLAAAFDFATANHFRATVFLVLCGLVLFLPGFFNIPADRPRRGAVRAGDQADGRERRFRRYPLPGRRPLQEAGRHLLAAGCRGGNRLVARPAAGAVADLALPDSFPDRRHRRGAADLLDGARLRDAARRRAGGADDVQFRPARRRSPARQDRRDAAVDRGRRDGRDGAGLSVLAARRGSGRVRPGRRPRCSGRRWPAASCSRGR